MSNSLFNILPARTKLERSEKGRKRQVFRCGVLTCPEILAYREWRYIPGLHRTEETIEASVGYKKNNAGIFIKTRRSVDRDHMSRTFADEKFQWESECILYNNELSNNEVGDMITGCLTKRRNETPEIPRFFNHDNLPANFKCARCGRLSKISLEVLGKSF